MMSGGWSEPGVEGWKLQGLQIEAQYLHTLTQRAIALIFKTAPNTPVLPIYFMGLVEAEFDGAHGISRGREKMVGWVKNSLKF